MKLVIPQPDLLAAINRVRSVVETANTIPVLTFLKLVADGETLAITATDMTIQATARVPVDIEADGEVLVESAKLFEFVRRIPDDRAVSIETGENNATIKAGRSRATLATLPVSDFPVPRDEIDGDAFVLTVDQIKHILFGPMPAVSDEVTRYYLCGVHLHAEGIDELIGVATDGHKLIKKVTDAPDGSTSLTGVIIPSKAITILQKCIGEDDVKVQADSRTILFSTDAFEIQSRLIDGQFPDYMRVIPKERENPVTVHRAEAIAVAERVAAITSKRADLRTLIFEHDETGIAVHTPMSHEGEQANDIILAETNGEFPPVGFDMRKIIALLGAMEGDEIVMHFNDTGAPHVFTSSERPKDIHVLMPVRC